MPIRVWLLADGSGEMKPSKTYCHDLSVRMLLAMATPPSLTPYTRAPFRFIELSDMSKSVFTITRMVHMRMVARRYINRICLP